jgi:hypothetical protein
MHQKLISGHHDGRHADTATRAMPAFMIASAAPARPAPVDAAAWRVVLANLLAGAVAGCAVEGGERAAHERRMRRSRVPSAALD